MYQTILVPLDGSVLSEQALPIAQTLAQRTSAAMHLVHVHTLNDGIYMEELPVIDDQLHSLGRTHEHMYLEQVRERLATTAQISITTANPDTEGTVALTLANYARDAACDLTIMATHGHSGFERFWLGSTTDALLRLTNMPLLLIRPKEQEPLTVPPAVQHIIIPLDGSHLAEAVLEQAVLRE